jgi:ubiquitin-activating enzyme E1
MGVLFWQGTKKFPQYRDFDIENTNDYNFITSMAQLRAYTCNIIIEDNINIKKVIENHNVPQYIESNTVIAINEEQQKKLYNDKYNTFDRETLYSKIHGISIEQLYALQVNVFEKDDDTNHMIDFIHSFSNLRAENYRIKTVDKLETKKVAGKIIPAIATTTSLISGLAAIEFIKVLQNKPKIENYRNYFVNLALPLFTYSEPYPVKINQIGKFKFSLWDSFDFKDCKFSEIFDYFMDNYNIMLTTIMWGQKMLYSGFMNDTMVNERKNQKVSEVVQDNIDNHIIISVFGESCDTDMEDEIELPVCKIFF